MRRLGAVLVAVLLLGGTVWEGAAATRLYRTRIVRCNETARSLFSSGPRRAQVRIMNLGTDTVFIGEAGGTLTVASGWPIHATSLAANIILRDSTGGMDCMTANTDSVEVGVLEELE